MAGRKTISKKKQLDTRVALRFSSEEDYAAVHHAAARAGLSMNSWILSVVLQATGTGRVPKVWKRQENRNKPD